MDSETLMRFINVERVSARLERGETVVSTTVAVLAFDIVVICVEIAVLNTVVVDTNTRADV